MELTERWDHLCLACFEDTSGAQICPSCGYKGEIQRPCFALPARTLLHGRYRRYLLGRVLRNPNEAEVTYAAFDTESRVRLTIREYFPRSLAYRPNGSGVEPLSTEAPFIAGLKGFIEDARILQSLHHPNVISISDILEQNGTAYVLEDYCDGLSLADYLDQRGGKLSEGAVLSIFTPVLDALSAVHEKGLLHLDIRPENILMTESFGPILTGFAAYRIALAERMLCLPALAQPGYSPIEQYLNCREIGPWSDVYSCAATIYQMLSGTPPAEAVERLGDNPLVTLDRPISGISAGISLAVMRGLAPDPRARPRSIQDFNALLMRESEQANRSEGGLRADLSLHAQVGESPLGYAAKAGSVAGVIACTLLIGYLVATKRTELPQRDASARPPREFTDSRIGSQGLESQRDQGLPPPEVEFSPANALPTPEVIQTPKVVSAIYESFSQELKGKAVSGDRDAQARLAWVYENGKGISKSSEKAFKWYRLAAMQDFPEAQTALGRFYITGKVVTRNPGKAIQWYKRAADQGYAEAQFALGTLYELGLGVSQRKDEALKWYQAAANSGNAMAQNRLGRIYDEGQGVPEDDREAAKWYRLAAEQGDLDAQYNLALMYEHGEGVPQDRGAALYWYRKGATGGHAGAKVKLKNLISRR